MLPTMVLLPGMDGTGELFQPFLIALKNEFKTIVVKYPTGKPLSYNELALLVTQQLPTNERFVLLAESFSGPIAVSLAAARPKGLVGLVLCATFVRNPRPNLRYLLPLLRAIPLNWIPSPVIRFFFLDSLANQQSCAQLLKVLRSVDQAVLVHRFQSLVAVDVADELQLIDVPLLYLMGSRDRLVPAIAVAPFKRLRQCQIRKFDAPHLLLQSNAEEAATAVKTFLTSLVGPEDVGYR